LSQKGSDLTDTRTISYYQNEHFSLASEHFRAAEQEGGRNLVTVADIFLTMLLKFFFLLDAAT
jgi:hypothetical protein